MKKTSAMSIMLFKFYIKATWSEWGAWKTCSQTCGNGNQIRVKECVNSGFTDVSCDGELPMESQTCNEGQCRKFLSKN